jgi:hypothetical protein
MIPSSGSLAFPYASRHCTQYGCRKCIARSRWFRRKKWRTRKIVNRRNTGRK